MTNRLRLLLTILPALLLGLGLAACDDPKPAAAGTGTVANTSTATPALPANTTASIAGVVSVPPDSEGFGVTIFAEGTSFMALSASDGSYQLSGLPVGTYTIRAMRPDLQSVVIDTVEVRQEDLLKKQPFQTLPGVFLEAREGAISGASARGQITGSVRAVDSTDASGITASLEGTAYSTTSGSNGSFTLADVEPGTYTLTFSKSGYSPASLNVTLVPGQELRLNPTYLVPSAEASAETRSLSGRVQVLMADGSPMRDYSPVRVVLEGTAFSATPDSTGRFQIANIPPGQYVVSAAATGFLLESKQNVDLRNLAAGQVILTLLEDTTLEESTGSLVGRVLLEGGEGQSAAGVAVSVAGTTSAAYTDPQGFYSIVGVTPGAYQVVASLVGYRNAMLPAVTITADATTELPDLILKRDVPVPRVVFTNPADGTRDVAINHPTPVVIQFSANMNTPSVVQAITIRPEVGFRVVPQGGGPTGGTNTFILELAAIPVGNAPFLQYGTRYTVTVAQSAMNVEGTPMEEDFEMDFTTGFPMVIGTLPEDGAEQVIFAHDSPLRVFFNAPIDRGSIRAEDISISPRLPAGGPRIHFQTDQKTGWSTMSIAGQAEFGTRYTVTIGRGAETVNDQRVRNLPYRFSFTSAEAVTFEEVYGTRGPGFDLEDRERQRTPRR